jgi:uroporphyrinogen-III synthase/uroporphyrinogen III methyltransferase/synthase
VVVTRAREQAGELIRRLEELGAEVLLKPSVAFAEPEETSGLDQALRSLDTFHWVVFTSQNAVRFVCRRCRALGIEWPGRVGARPRVAAVGPTTAAAAREEGVSVDRVASRPSGEALVQELGEEMAGRRVFLPRSDRARPALPEALRAAGAEGVEVVAYRTVAPGSEDGAVLEKIQNGEVDLIAFASPSALHHLSEELGGEAMSRISGRVAFAAIGPVTAKALREAGLPVEIEAGESTAEGLARAIAGYFARRQHSSSGARPQ